MNCPDCQSLMLRNMCSCGFTIPARTTIEYKRVDMKETNEPLPINEKIKNVSLSGKAYAEYCIDYAKKILRGQNVN